MRVASPNALRHSARSTLFWTHRAWRCFRRTPPTYLPIGGEVPSTDYTVNQPVKRSTSRPHENETPLATAEIAMQRARESLGNTVT
jgi:hypothetical protein